MMALPMRLNETDYSLFLIIEPENITRMMLNDPAEFNVYRMGEPWEKLRLRDIVLTMPSASDIAAVMRFMDAGDAKGALRLITRGYKFMPERGDGGEYMLHGKRS